MVWLRAPQPGLSTPDNNPKPPPPPEGQAAKDGSKALAPPPAGVLPLQEVGDIAFRLEYIARRIQRLDDYGTSIRREPHNESADARFLRELAGVIQALGPRP